jgi:hypothetical protein
MLGMISPGFCLARVAENERRAEQCDNDDQRAAWLDSAEAWRRISEPAALPAVPLQGAVKL